MKDFKISSLNDIYGGLLKDRQSEILRDYFDYDLSYTEIGQAYGITRQAVGQAIESSSKQLELYEQTLGLLDILHKLKELKTSSDSQQSQVLEEIIASILKNKH